MPINLYWEERGALLEIVGNITLGDFRHVLKLSLLDSRYDSSCYLIVDCTQQAIGKALGKWELEVLAFFTRGMFKERFFVSAAVVNPQNPANVAAAECYAKLAANPHRIFTSLVNARQWVDEELKT